MIVLLILVTTLVTNSEGMPNSRPKLERNNILNKGVWVRNGDGQTKRHIFEKGETGDFIFLENSLDADNTLQYNADVFNDNDNMQETPIAPNYLEREKRSNAQKRRPRSKNSNICKDNSCTNQIDDTYENQSGLASSRIINDLRPASVFNDYPYEVAILLGSNSSELGIIKNNTKKHNEKLESNEVTKRKDRIVYRLASVNNNTTGFNDTSPKRSMKYDYETEVVNKFEITHNINKEHSNTGSNDNKATDNNIFGKDNGWNQIDPMPDINVYQIVPTEQQTHKPITEKGLVKVISMLTKTFKKIVKQHNEIKKIHSKISDINNDFIKNSALLTDKFAGIDLKYMYVLKFHEKLKLFEAKLASKEEYFNKKEKEMAKSFNEFENTQKKFLQQQRQFFSIQKLMLAQNERINLKQNLIAKTQSEISHRQNNFARILKKAKELYMDAKKISSLKPSSTLTKPNDFRKHYERTTTEPTSTSSTTVTYPPSTTSPSTTESIKIDLFSIPTLNKIIDQDDLIIKEKDEQNIDDLVYKYYFNNTYIDNFMKNKVLANFAINTDTKNNHLKSKRSEDLETTLLFPVMELNDSETDIPKNRERRWINHHSKHKHKRRYRGKQEIPTAAKVANDNSINKINNNNIPTQDKESINEKVAKKDPFWVMAMNFCNEIHKNDNNESLALCVEKVLRKLSYMNFNMTPALNEKPVGSPMKPLFTEKVDKTQAPVTHIIKTGAETLPTNLSPSNTMKSTEKPRTTSSPPIPVPQHFPDNDILEYNLRQYVIDAKPDVEGNVYYEGSVHASEIVGDESQGIDDIIPGMESNSQVDVDPVTFDLQARRRAFVRQLNERIKKTLG